MELIGYIGAACIGLSLGLIGAGGSILTVPLLVYFFQVPVLLASSYSLAIVGCTSFLGAVVKYQKGDVHTKTALIFASLSVAVVSLVRGFIVPFIPVHLFSINGFVVESAMLTMVLFSLLMIATAFGMMKQTQKFDKRSCGTVVNVKSLVFTSVSVGFITGLLGAGGGFLLVPALLTVFHLPMREAVGTSLAIIAFNSLTGFGMDLSHFKIDWLLLATVLAVSAMGLLLGISLSKQFTTSGLRVLFGWFIVSIGIVILIQEIVSIFQKNKHGVATINAK